MSLPSLRNLLLTVVGASMLALGAGACGGAQKAYVPVDSPLREWEKPDEADLTGEPGDETEDTGDDSTSTDDGSGAASK